MQRKTLSKLVALSLIASSLSVFSPVKAQASELSTSKTDTANSRQKRTAYDWTVRNLGVNANGISQIKGPMFGGNFNTEGAFGGNRTFTITWSGASSNAMFRIKAVGQDDGNKGSTNYSSYCDGSSGSVTLTIPYEDRGVLKLYVDSDTPTTINIGTLNVDSR